MAGPKKTRGFTLVELLVVITIIGMLVSLLLPAIQSAREAGRKNTCLNNMRQCYLALSNFEQNKHGFPGYANLMNSRRVSWVIPILPYLERNDIYQLWQNPNTALNYPLSYTQMAVLTCPSNPSAISGNNPLSFVVNTGSAFTASENYPASASSLTNQRPDDINSGVFFNQCQWDGKSAVPVRGTTNNKVTMDFIGTNDGTTNTLMLSENLQATNWATDGTGVLDTNMNPAWYQSDYSLRQSTGFVWYPTGNQNNIGPASSMNFIPQAITINGLAKTITGTPVLAFNAMATTPSGLAYSRPSSNHPGGVNAFFCGGNGRFLAEDIGYHVYTQLMTSNQNAVSLSLSGVTPLTSTPAWNYILNEADF